MTNPTQKPIRDPEIFGREIAECARAEIRQIGLTLAEVAVRDQQLREVARRSVFAVDAAAMAHVADGMPAEDARAWANAAAAALGAAMTRADALA
ncbi:hypothetical protein [Methylobacterium sp. Leaf118]|uniref:hypothetical protein n=1 Tax=Methylobacterium sp. Leaf118 TaxID=2876562 RepID=UPI001E2C07CA|nr:hypothetical protein [Methylobacterium sp. Leaf118]